MTTEMTEPKYLTVAEVAARLRVSTRTVHRWIRAGTIAAIPLPGGQERRMWRIEEAEVERLSRGNVDGKAGP